MPAQGVAGRDEVILAGLETPGGWVGGIAYRDLSAGECQCLAARESLPGNLLASKSSECCEASSGGLCGKDEKKERTARLRRIILQGAEMEERNRTAGLALDLFYQLAEAEANRGVLGDSLAELDDALGKIQVLRAQGLPVGEEETTLRDRRNALLGDEVELELGIDRLNGQLLLMLKLAPPDAAWRLRPIDSGEFNGAVELNSAVAEGLSRRPELIALRRAEAAMDASTEADIRQMLAKFEPFLGIDCAPKLHPGLVLIRTLAAPFHGDEEASSSIRRQVSMLRADRERAVAEEVRQGVLEVWARDRQIVIAGDRVRQAEADLGDRRAQQAQGVGSFAALAAARLKLLEAQGAELARRKEAAVARVKVRQAQGVLGQECN